MAVQRFAEMKRYPVRRGVVRRQGYTDHLMMTIIDKTITNLRFPISFLVIGLMVAMSIDDPWMIVRFLLVMGLTAFFYMLYYLRSERNWEFAYGILYAYFSAFTLFWIFPYALLTLRSRSWMTR